MVMIQGPRGPKPGAFFAVQKRGTARVGQMFGPVMLLWFVVIGGLGAVEVGRHPGILHALNPWHGARLLVEVPGAAFFVDGAGQGSLRLSFSSVPASRIDEGVRRLAETIRAAQRRPGRPTAPEPLAVPLV